jgi:hypothetical protein
LNQKKEKKKEKRSDGQIRSEKETVDRRRAGSAVAGAERDLASPVPGVLWPGGSWRRR